MNLQKLFCLAVMASVSTNVIAMEIYKGKVLSEKIYASDGSKATLAPQKNTMLPRHNDSDYAYTTANIPSGHAKVNTPVVVDGSLSVSFVNSTEETRHYTVLNRVCSRTTEATNHCVYYHKEIELQPQGSFFEDALPLLKMTYSKPGSYKIWVESGFYQYGENGTFPTFSDAVNTMVVA